MFVSEIKELHTRLEKIEELLIDANDSAINTESTIPEYNACEDARHYANSTVCYMDDILVELEELKFIIKENELSKNGKL
tara:strand:+ start:381 stop:620 length:240 start_codon:yes stop_codon:yes gene_type:complete